MLIITYAYVRVEVPIVSVSCKLEPRWAAQWADRSEYGQTWKRYSAEDMKHRFQARFIDLRNWQKTFEEDCPLQEVTW